MPRPTHLTATSGLIFMLASSMAWAELTSEGVWTQWKDYMSGLGYSISAQEQQSATGLTVSDIKLTFELPEDEGTMTMDVGTIVFTNEAEGSVRIDTGEVMDIPFTVDPTTGDTVSGTLSFTQSDYSLIASGAREDITYTYDAGTLAFTMAGLTVDDETFGADVMNIDVRMSGLKSVSNVKGTELRTFDQTMTVDALEYDVAFSDPESEGSMRAGIETNGVSFSGTGSFPANLDMNNARSMLDAGLTFDGGYTLQGGASEFTFNDSGDSGTFNTTGTGGSFSFAISDEGLNYAITQEGVNVNALFSSMPIPVSFASDVIKFDFLIPTVKKADAQDLGLLVSLEGFSMADTLWGLFDPTGQLPRDPATITADLSGTAKLLFDYLDPTQAELLEQSGAAPGEMESLTLKSLIVDAAGARLTGQGDFTFDNSDTTTFPGMPRPEGAVDLQLKGGNGLLDKLVNMGLLPQDQAMGARMMMGLFARPGEGEDSLVSKIEVNDQGHVLANGQRIQ